MRAGGMLLVGTLPEVHVQIVNLKWDVSGRRGGIDSWLSCWLVRGTVVISEERL